MNNNDKVDLEFQGKDIFIVTGGILTEKLVSIIPDDSVIIGVDRGAEWLIEHNRTPHFIVGDFDSAKETFLDTIQARFRDKIQLFPSEKDETDTELAMRYAISFKPKTITVLGAIGTRLDHVLGNIHVLLQAEEQGIPSRIVGLNNRIQLLLSSKERTVYKGEYNYVSLLPFTETVEGIDIQGFKYPLSKASMRIGIPYGISNELIEVSGTITIEKGVLLVIESKD